MTDSAQHLVDSGATYSTPVGEVLARVGRSRVVAVLDEDAPHGFALARIGEVER